MNKIVFWNQVIEALEYKEKNFVETHSKMFTEQYFEDFKNNEFHDYGKICLTLKQAKEDRQKIMDLFTLNKERRKEK